MIFNGISNTFLYNLQETPETFSVYKKKFRTTSQVENFNGRMNSKFPKGGNFFKFVAKLADVDTTQVREMRLLSLGGIQRIKKNPRDAKILESTKRLDNNEITPFEFITQMVYEANKIVCNMANYTGSTNDGSESAIDESDTAVEGQEESVQINVTIDNCCCVCLIAKSNTLLLPCKHVKTCETCTEQLAAKIPFKCPVCQTGVLDRMVVYV